MRVEIDNFDRKENAIKDSTLGDTIDGVSTPAGMAKTKTKLLVDQGRGWMHIVTTGVPIASLHLDSIGNALE